MGFKKVLYITEEQKKELDGIKNEIKERGGTVTVMRLMQDGISVFLDKYRDQAVAKYIPVYE